MGNFLDGLCNALSLRYIYVCEYSHYEGSRGILIDFQSVELIARIIVSGFFFNPDEYSAMNGYGGFQEALLRKIKDRFSTRHQPIIHDTPNPIEPDPPPILHSFTGIQSDLHRPGHTKQQQRVRLARRAFLRHSFNRLDFVAVTSFWISFILGLMGVESEKHLYVFRMLSCLRILRLLGITSGTSVRILSVSLFTRLTIPRR